jgi:phosphoribosylformimino-5-aminoimidazole carboxamide ribonucleotide (ProFAR) isomerase
MLRPCVDLHDGKVKQIVGGSLTDSGAGLPFAQPIEQPHP